MNHFKYLIVVLAFVATLVSCEREYDAPPLSKPTYTGAEANITIAALKAEYANISDPTVIDSDYILKAYVTGNDVSGNIYKQLYIQDETAGINIGIDQNSVYTEFGIGQEIYINLKGLSMVKYGSQLQIGYKGTNANRISWNIFTSCVSKNNWPLSKNVSPKVVDLSKLDENMINTLVELNGVYFVDGGKLKFSEANSTTNRTLKDSKGNSIIVRNSNYAKFATDKLPLGTGTLTGILSKFNSTWQFIIRSKDDVGKFDGKAPSDSNPTDDTTSDNAIFSEPFSASLGKFTQYSVAGSQVWAGESFKDSKYVILTGYNKATKTTEANEDWLISPAIDLSKLTSANIGFSHAVGYQMDMQKEETLWISSDYTDGNPSNATWTQITITYPPKEPFWTWVDVSAKIPETMLGKNNIRIAFKFTCGSKSSTWEIKNFTVNSSKGGTVIYPKN